MLHHVQQVFGAVDLGVGNQGSLFGTARRQDLAHLLAALVQVHAGGQGSAHRAQRAG
ncbi:hypothetical protein D3C72_2432450 [compost metagenome]